MVADKVNKFGQIFPIHERWRIWGNFHPFYFTPKSHLRRIISCQGYSTFFSKFISESLCIFEKQGRLQDSLRYTFNLYSPGEDFLSSVPLYVFVFFKRSTTSSTYCNLQSFNFLLIQRIMSILYLTRQLIIIYYALRSKNTYFSAWTCPLPFPSTLWVDSVDSCKALHYSPNWCFSWRTHHLSLEA
jgi:hypothetical protein